MKFWKMKKYEFQAFQELQINSAGPLERAKGWGKEKIGEDRWNSNRKLLVDTVCILNCSVFFSFTFL